MKKSAGDAQHRTQQHRSRDRRAAIMTNRGECDRDAAVTAPPTTIANRGARAMPAMKTTAEPGSSERPLGWSATKAIASAPSPTVR